MEKKPDKFTSIYSIKSAVVLKKIFSLLYLDHKFDLITYNKHFQKLLDLSIEDYKNRSKRYKIAQRNGTGKEYSIITNKIIFEGEYLNGKRNGKGKEYYDNGQLKFEGEYLIGKKECGLGYDKLGNIILDLRKGKIKEYYDNGNL